MAGMSHLQECAAIGEAVWSHVQDTHHPRPRLPCPQAAVAQRDDGTEVVTAHIVLSCPITSQHARVASLVSYFDTEPIEPAESFIWMQQTQVLRS